MADDCSGLFFTIDRVNQKRFETTDRDELSPSSILTAFGLQSNYYSYIALVSFYH